MSNKLPKVFRNRVYSLNSYNKINGTYACENGGIMNKLLKDELGFPGYVMSDWNGKDSSILLFALSVDMLIAQHTTTGSANGGMDMTMPGRYGPTRVQSYVPD